MQRSTVYACSLGCAKNLVDTELMLGALVDEGFELTDEPASADIILVNTCSFIEPAREESIETILELARWKSQGETAVLIVAGCLAERYGRELFEEMPEIDGLLGIFDWSAITEVIRRCLQGERVMRVSGHSDNPNRRSRVITTGPFTAYLKVSEGCDNRCNYCAIPSIRGSLASRDPAEVVAEAKTLTELGVKELVLIAQDLTAYGRDTGGPPLEDLVNAIVRKASPEWVRLLYCHPLGITPGLVGLLKSGSLCRYLDIPMQHGSAKVLKAMGRRGSPRDYLRLIEDLKREVPGISLRSSFMVGHPGESDKEFQELLSFLEDASLDRVGFFKYSREEDTLSGRRVDQVPEGVKEERLQQAIAVQSEIARLSDEARVGQGFHLLVEGGGSPWIGRLEGQAPEVDGRAFLDDRGQEVLPGQIVRATVAAVRDADFICRL